MSGHITALQFYFRIPRLSKKKASPPAERPTARAPKRESIPVPEEENDAGAGKESAGDGSTGLCSVLVRTVLEESLFCCAEGASGAF